MRFRKRPVVVEAHRWWKNGDHPDDGSVNGSEGRVVRYFRRPDVRGETLCSECGRKFDDHGWMDTLEDDHRVCPGDWIITGVANEMYPCKDRIFKATYDPIDMVRCSGGADGTGVAHVILDVSRASASCGQAGGVSGSPADGPVSWRGRRSAEGRPASCVW